MAAPKNHEAYNKNGEGGRPRRYSVEEINRLADEFSDWLKNANNVWFKDFALDKDIDPDLFSQWAKENDRFAGVYRQARHRQESRLINGGLLNAYNGSIVKLVLANAHGWKTDKTETKLSGDAANPLQFLLEKIDGEGKELAANEPE